VDLVGKKRGGEGRGMGSWGYKVTVWEEGEKGKDGREG